MQSGVAASFRRGLELVSGGTLVAVGRHKATAQPIRATKTLMERTSCLQALSVSTLTQVNVWREVRTTGEDHEHDDYKASAQRYRSLPLASLWAKLAMLHRCAWKRSKSRRWRSNWSTAAKWLARANALAFAKIR